MDNLLHAFEANWVILVVAGVGASLLWALVRNLLRIIVARSSAAHVADELPPGDGDSIRDALRAELQTDRRKSFWPNLWLNLGTNFFTNLIFFILGIFVTLWATQPH